MLKKVVTGIVLMLLLTSVFSTGFIIQPVKADPGYIYIRADGSIDPPTAPIQRVGDVYTFTDNIYDSGIIVERNNIIVDGNGFTLQVYGYGKNGFYLSSRNNVTIKNVTIIGCYYGVLLVLSNYNNISKNNITSNAIGIYLHRSDYNRILENTITTSNGDAIWLDRSLRNSILKNTLMASGMYGIWICYSPENNISGNNIVASFGSGIFLYYSDNNTISTNNCSENAITTWGGGIRLAYSTNNHIFENNLDNNYDGIYSQVSGSNNTIMGNNFSNNKYGITLSSSSNNNSIMGNNFSNNEYGFNLYSSHNNLIKVNNINSNSHVGIYIRGSSNNNLLYHNNLINNNQNAYDEGGNIWDNGFPSGGNYWSDYTIKYPGAQELGGSGLWNTPYVISAYNQDNYPLMSPWISGPPTPPLKFIIGDWVQTTANLNVRDGPGISYTIIDTMPLGTIGQIMGEPVEADSYVWWDVNYAGGIRGWSAENWLELTLLNELPIALFQYSPEGPEAGEEVTFDASASYDPDGEIVLYAWDWDGDGFYDELTTSPIITFWWWENGVYTVTLAVIDDKGAINTKSMEITVSISSTSETIIVLASIWDRFSFGWDNGVALNQIDRYIRDGKGRPLDWINPYEKAELAYLLEKQIDPNHAPGLNYKTFARSKIREEDLVHKVFRYYISPSASSMKLIFNDVLSGVWGYSVDLSLLAVSLLNPLVGAGLQTIYLGSQMYGLYTIFQKINKDYYTIALANYFLNRGNFGKSPESAWTTMAVALWSPLELVDKSINARTVPIAEGETREKILQDTWFYFEELWQEYKDEGDFGFGLYHSFRYSNRNKLKELFLSGLEDAFGNRELLDRKIMHVDCPVEIRVYDVEGRTTGFLNGEEKTEISQSIYDNKTKTITVFLPSDPLRYEVEGTGEGIYVMELTSMENGNITNFTAIDIPISPLAIHRYTIDWEALVQDQLGVTIEIDADGDGVFERTITSDGELTLDEFLLLTATTIDFKPDTFNRKSQGKWVTTYIELPEGFNVSNVTLSSIKLNGVVPAEAWPTEIGDYNDNGVPDLMVKFSRSAVAQILQPGTNVEIKVSGSLTDGMEFEGVDYITVLN